MTSTASLSGLDYGIIAAFLFSIMLIGVILARAASKNMESYFLGGRQMPWYILGVSGMSAWFDLTGTMLITSFLYLLGPRGLFVEFRGGAVLVLAFLMAYMAKWNRRSGCMTAAEWATYRFGTGISGEFLRGVNAVMGIALAVGQLAYVVKGATLFMGVIFPVDPVWLTVGVLGFASVFTVLAGFYGMVIADFVQGAIMIVGCLVISWIAWGHVSSAADLNALAEHVTGNRSWITSHPSTHVDMPAGYEAYKNLVMAAIFYLARNIIAGMGAGGELRFFASKTPREASLQCLIQGLTVMFRWPLMISFAILGILLVNQILPNHESGMRAAQIIHEANPSLAPGSWDDYVANLTHHPETAPPGTMDKIQAQLGSNWKAALLLVSYRGTVDPERVLPTVILQGLGSGLRGLLVVCLLAALMGSLSNLVNTSSSYFTRDLYQNFLRRNAANRELIICAYTASTATVVVAFIMGLAATSINDLWSWLTMGLVAGSIGPMMLRFYWWRINAWGMVFGTAVGGLGAIVQRIVAPDLLEWYQFPLMAGSSFVGTIIGSLLTQPTPTKIIAHFYHTTRPFGFWKPFHRELPPETRALWFREHRADILSAFSILVTQVCLFMLPMQFLTRNWTGFFCTLPIFLTGTVAIYDFWWRNLPPENDADGEPRTVSVAKITH